MLKYAVFILFSIYLVSCAKRPCAPDGGCKTNEDFVESFAKSIVENDRNMIESHFLNSYYRCNVDSYLLDGQGWNLGGVKNTELISGKLSEYRMIVNSEAAKINLFNEIESKSTETTDAEIMSEVIDRLTNPDFIRREVPLKSTPSFELRLSFNKTEYSYGHPCWANINKEKLVYALVAEDMVVAVDPVCDIVNSTGQSVLKKPDFSEASEKIFKESIEPDLDYYLRYLEKRSLPTVMHLMERLNIEYGAANYIVDNKLCPIFQ